MSKKQQPLERRSIKPSKSANVFSYYQSRSGADTQRARYEPPAGSRKGLDRLKHTPTILAMIVIIGCVLYASMLNNQPRIIVAVTESGKSLQQEDTEYSNYAAQLLSTSIANKSKLTFNSEPVVRELQKQFPEIDNAIITVPILGHRPIIRIAVSSPAFSLSTSSGSYYINGRGIPLVRVSDVKSPLKDIVTVKDESGIPVEVGKQVLPQDTVTFITDIIQHLRITNTNFQGITLPLEANEVQVEMTGKPYIARFNVLEDARTQVGTLRAVETRLQGSRDTPKEYIDVRVAERAYYK